MFSEVIDTCIQRSGRPDLLVQCPSWLNLTVLELIGNTLYVKNLIEDQITVVSVPVLWTRPTGFQKMRTVRYPDDSVGDPVFPDFIPPSRRQGQVDNYYYAASQYFAFKGRNLVSGSKISLAYFKVPASLKYFQVGQRPASYDFELEQYTYYNLRDVPNIPAWLAQDWTLPENQERARELTGNWLLLDWHSMLEEGLLAKIFKQAADTTRGATAYSFFQSMKEIYAATELVETAAS